MHCFKKRIFFEKFSGSKGLREFEGVAMQKLVIKFWKQGWQATKAVVGMVEPVRRFVGEISMLVRVWRGETICGLDVAQHLFRTVECIAM